ncbi:MAG: pyridoxal-dependent decarboxylase [Actinomycetota bacterium]
MTGETLVERIAARALHHLLHPPGGDDPVLIQSSPPELADAFESSVGLALDSGEAHGDEALLAAVDQVIERSVRTSHPRFMNQNFAGPDPVAVVGDFLGAVLNTTNATYEVAPVFTLMEHAVLSRLARLVGFDVDRDGLAPGLFCAGGSLAGMIALQLARHGADPEVLRRGAVGPPPAVFVSGSGHYSAAKNTAMLGMGLEAVIEVGTDDRGAMDVAQLRLEVEKSRALGRLPLAVIATAGTTVTAAFDPIDAIADVCSAEGLWLHVDACYGGSALFSAAERGRLAGAERADSLVWNLHKMMGMTQQCTALLVRDPAQLDACFATGADYLFQPEKEHGHLDAGDRTVMCGRRVDVLKLWLAWKAHGDAGFEERIDHAVALASHARERVLAGDLGLAPVVAGDFTNVCFLWVPPELRPFSLDSLSPEDHRRLHAVAPGAKRAMLAAGGPMLGYQPVRGINCFRLLVMNPAVTTSDVDAALDAVARHSEAAWVGAP